MDILPCSDSYTRHEAPGHIVTYRAGAAYRQAFCECGWRDQVERKGNAWAQTSRLRGKVRGHVKAANNPALRSSGE